MDKEHRRGYSRMVMVVGGLALLTITVIGSIGLVSGFGREKYYLPQGFFQVAALTVWAITALAIIGFVIWVIARFLHRWAQLLGGGK